MKSQTTRFWSYRVTWRSTPKENIFEEKAKWRRTQGRQGYRLVDNTKRQNRFSLIRCAVKMKDSKFIHPPTHLPSVSLSVCLSICKCWISIFFFFVSMFTLSHDIQYFGPFLGIWQHGTGQGYLPFTHQQSPVFNKSVEEKLLKDFFVQNKSDNMFLLKAISTLANTVF